MENFIKENIVPGVVKESPNAKLTVQWDGKDLEPGAQWTPTQVQNQPKVIWQPEEGVLYTLVMLDPDSPSRYDQSDGQALHWLVTNIPGSNIEEGDQFAEYVGSGAPKDSGLHRYCLFLFKQPGKIEVNLKKASKCALGPRRKFKIQALVEKHNLGTAVAGNLFLAKYDDYVPKLHAEFRRHMIKNCVIL